MHKAHRRPRTAEVRDALARLTGFHAKVTSGRIEIVFADEHELAEIAEALEASVTSERVGE